MPRTREALEALPGVGRKTANVVLNVAFGEPTIAVDTHIFRVGNRTGLAPGKDPLEVEQKLEQVVPAKYKLHAHHWLILHGRYTCVARKPLCERCVIADLCKWPGKTVAVKRRGSWRMEGSAGKANQSDPKMPLGAAGLPEKAAAAWLKAQPRFTGNFKRDAAAGTKFWRDGADLLAKLPEKPKRTPAQTTGGGTILSDWPRRRAKRFSTRHAEAVYRKLTSNLEAFVRVEDLVYDAAKLVPGLTPTRQQVDGARPNSCRARKTASKSTRAFSSRKCWRCPSAGMHLCHAMLRPKPEALERLGEFIERRRGRFRPGARSSGRARPRS